jgi:Helix-turn-helix domain
MGAAENISGKVWFTSKEAAAELGITVAALKSLVYRERLSPDHRGGQDGLKSHRFHRSTLEAFLTKNRSK